MKSLDLKLAESIEKLSHAISYLQKSTAEEAGISSLQLQFLDYLLRYQEPDRTVSAMAREFSLTKATVSEAVKNLEAKGFIAKEMSRYDSRVHVINLTPSGKKLSDRISNVRSYIASKFSDEKDIFKSEIYDFLIRLIAELSSDNIIPFARICPNCENYSIDRTAGAGKCGLTGITLLRAGVNIGCESFKARG
jgi:DNA-binding MarR family transcriptional regulator